VLLEQSNRKSFLFLDFETCLRALETKILPPSISPHSTSIKLDPL